MELVKHDFTLLSPVPESGLDQWWGQDQVRLQA